MATLYYLVTITAIITLSAQAWILPFTSNLHEGSQLHAQATCAGLEGNTGWVSAVPRNCQSGQTCNSICAKIGSTAPDSQRKNAGSHYCINSLHIYNQALSKGNHIPGLKTYKYNSCRVTSCGPNFCCCISTY